MMPDWSYRVSISESRFKPRLALGKVGQSQYVPLVVAYYS